MTAAVSESVRRLGVVSRDYERLASEYQDIAIAAAEAESDYRKEKAKAMLVAMADGASAVKAEAQANADDRIAEICRQYKITAALADATRAKLTQLREQVAVGRSMMVAERESDRIHAGSAT